VSKPLTDFTGGSLYLDTMIPYALLRAIDPASQTLFARIQAGEIVAFTSVLTFDELTYRLLLALIRDQYGGSPLEHLRDNGLKMIAQFYPTIEPYLTQLRHFPNLTLLEITASYLEAMSQAILQHHLKPRDALHLAAMQKCGCFNLASQDNDFDHVPGIQRYTLA
jgi:predicted nucleic acid-binding protein